MSLINEDLNLKDAIKHPKLFILYALFLGIGWTVDKCFPDDHQKDDMRCERRYDKVLQQKDSIQRDRDLLFVELLKKDGIIKEQKNTIKITDSVIDRVYPSAKAILNIKHHARKN